MPRLYCEIHGREHEAGFKDRREHYRPEDETVLVVTGRLISGPWLCDRCNAELLPGKMATLLTAFAAHSRYQLCDYDFGYERQYFAMRASDTATAYGAPWPDDSLRHRRPWRHSTRPKKPILALDLLPKQDAD